MFLRCNSLPVVLALKCKQALEGSRTKLTKDRSSHNNSRAGVINKDAELHLNPKDASSLRQHSNKVHLLVIQVQAQALVLVMDLKMVRRLLYVSEVVNPSAKATKEGVGFKFSQD